ncbi:MAG: hypothetical protein HN509_15030 [Halobacteriovoraceae bacterium]|jgi:hypothetical protein|nr:hypothetical protein [Halobacteriovoraceae bacterium]MBT5093365.1 hypothetical protein [Halobacteriovoraceae bacterium]
MRSGDLLNIRREFIWKFVKISVALALSTLLVFFLLQYQMLLEMQEMLEFSNGLEGEFGRQLLEEQRYIYIVVLAGTMLITFAGIMLGGLKLVDKLGRPLDKISDDFDYSSSEVLTSEEKEFLKPYEVDPNILIISKKRFH